jgi:hypothetical protein
MLYPRIKPELMERLESELLQFLLRGCKCPSCIECLFCWKTVFQGKTDTPEERDALMSGFLIPIKPRQTTIEFFELVHEDQREYYDSLDKAQERARELQDALIDVTIIGREFN